MTYRTAVRLACLFVLSSSGSAFAQSISTTPAAAVPALPPIGLLALAILLVGGGVWALRRGWGRAAATALLAVGTAGALLWSVQAVRAAVAVSFTNPAGETVSIPVTTIDANGSVAGWEAADFTNTSGTSLEVSAITLPDLAACLPGAVSGPLLPPLTPASPPQACSVGLVLADGDTCRVDVDTTCRAAVAGHLSTLTAVAPTSGTASGGTGFTLTGTGLTGATAVTFDGIQATAVNVVNATTVTGVTPAHAAGAVDVVIDTPQGTATLADGYTYLATAVGQPSNGGIIAALDGGLNNLIAAVADNAAGIAWGGVGTAVGPGAQSDSDGSENTVAIVGALGGATPYAAQLCATYEVDSQQNTPCQAGNTCYSDWFLPARIQLDHLAANRAAIGGLTTASYWSSTEHSSLPTLAAWGTQLSSVIDIVLTKDSAVSVRCVRSFTP
jgi:hypothetical protein